MGKYEVSGLFQSIRGKVGGLIFSHWLGIPVIYRKSDKIKNPRTVAQMLIRDNFLKLIRGWDDLSLTEQSLWEMYARRYSKPRVRVRTGIMHSVGNKMTGLNVYVSVNQMLFRCGFPPLRIPYLRASKPCLALSDLVHLGVYKGVLRFNIWFERPFSDACVSEVWVRKVGKHTSSYIAAVVPVSTTKSEVEIRSVRFKLNNKIVDKEMVSLGKCRLYVQFRVVSCKGTFSMPSALYKIEVVS